MMENIIGTMLVQRHKTFLDALFRRYPWNDWHYREMRRYQRLAAIWFSRSPLYESTAQHYMALADRQFRSWKSC